MRKWLLLVAVALSGCHPSPKTENQIAKDQETTAAPQAVVASYDGPFGIAKGEPLSALGEVEETRPGVYALSSVPQPYPALHLYSVENTPQHGTCLIKAISTFMENDGFGTTLKTAIDHAQDDLASRYGKPTHHYDFVKSGSIWTEPQEWMMALSKDERTYAYFWEAPKNPDPKIWRGVQNVGVSARSDGQKGWFIIEYDFEGNEQCADDLKHKAAQSL